MRILLLSLGIIIIGGLGLFTIRTRGLSQNHSQFDHSWNSKPTPWIALPWSSEFSNHAQVILWIDVYQSNEGVVFALKNRPSYLKKQYNADEFAKLEPVELSSLVESLKDRDLVLNVISNKELIDEKIAGLFDARFDNHILIQSDYDVILDSLKKLKPMWLYGTSSSERVRFRTLESMWVEPAMKYSRDVYVGPLRQKGVELLSENILSELKRRKKKILVGPLSSKDEQELVQRLGIDGVFIDQPELIRLVLGL